MKTGITLTKQTTVACEGEPSPNGHPRVFLKIENGAKIQCPYCSKIFVNTNEDKLTRQPTS